MGVSAETAADFIVVGAGIVGCVTALRAAEAGAKVIVVEKEVAPASESSGRAQGALRALGKHGSMIPLAAEALGHWKAIADDADAEIVLKGSISVARTQSELPAMVEALEKHGEYGLPLPKVLTEAQTRECVPALKGFLVGAVWRKEDGHCNPRKATLYFAQKAERAGVVFHCGVKALRILERDGAVVGLETNFGRLNSKRVALATGMWTSLLARTVGIRVPILPLILSGCETTPLAPLFEQSVRSYGFSGHQRPNGRVVVSAGVNARVRHEMTLASFDWPTLWLPRFAAHFRNVRMRIDGRQIARQLEFGDRWSTEQIQEEMTPKSVDRQLMRRALAHAQSLIPELKDVKVSRYWSGYIDMSPDALPIIDTDSCPKGMVVAAGLSGHGLVLGPVLGAMVSELALEGHSTRPVRPFRLARFVEERVPIPANTI